MPSPFPVGVMVVDRKTPFAEPTLARCRGCHRGRFHHARLTVRSYSWRHGGWYCKSVSEYATNRRAPSKAGRLDVAGANRPAVRPSSLTTNASGVTANHGRSSLAPWRARGVRSTERKVRRPRSATIVFRILKNGDGRDLRCQRLEHACVHETPLRRIDDPQMTDPVRRYPADRPRGAGRVRGISTSDRFKCVESKGFPRHLVTKTHGECI
jgi:hypothetical protein